MTWPTLDELLARTIADPETGCLLWTGARFGGTGYGAVNRRGTVRSTHRLAWEAAYGDIPPGLLVQHTCDVRACIRPEHLTLGTPQSNVRDARRKGRLVTLRGEDSPRAKLSNADVDAIRALRAAGWTRRAVAEMYGTTRDYVTAITTGYRRSH